MNKPSQEFIEEGRKFKQAVKQGRVFTSIDGVKQKVIDHGYHYKKRYIKTEESKEKLYIHDDIEFQILQF